MKVNNEVDMDKKFVPKEEFSDYTKDDLWKNYVGKQFQLLCSSYLSSICNRVDRAYLNDFGVVLRQVDIYNVVVVSRYSYVLCPTPSIIGMMKWEFLHTTECQMYVNVTSRLLSLSLPYEEFILLNFYLCRKDLYHSTFEELLRIHAVRIRIS